MHTLAILVALAVWFFTTFVGRAVAVFYLMDSADDTKSSKEQRTRRLNATWGSVAAGVVLAVAYASAFCKGRGTIEYWAVLAILLFGVIYAVYTAVPTATPGEDTVEQSKRTKHMIATTHAVALGGAFAAYLAAIVYQTVQSQRKQLASFGDDA